MIVLYVFILFELNQAILGWGHLLDTTYVHIINPRKFNWRNLPMSTSTSMSLSVSVSMDTDTDRDMDVDVDMGTDRVMDVDVDMGRWTRTGTWTWTSTWADPRRFIAGDVLSRRCFVRRRFVTRRRFVSVNEQEQSGTWLSLHSHSGIYSNNAKSPSTDNELA
jgi:hypothetical protein